MPSPPINWPVALLHASLRLVGALPLRPVLALGAVLGRLAWALRGRSRRIAERNLALVLTQESAETRQSVAKKCVVETGRSAGEILAIWGGGPDKALRRVVDVRGREWFDDACAAGRGVLIAAPHLGCWELLNYWLATQRPLAILYRPPRHAWLEPLLRRVRGALPVEQIRAEGSGVRALYKRLAAGGMVGILPDQQPRQGEGEFAPFFGAEALTMVLVSRLAQRTNANVLFAFVQRLPHGSGYDIHLRAAPDGIADPDLRLACTALNGGVEDCVRLAFDQYQWSYKRYSLRPDKGVPNPYN